MAFITDILNTIKNARKGKDMRQAIYDGIQQCYEDATGHPDSVAAVVERLKIEKGRIDELATSQTFTGNYTQSNLVFHAYRNATTGDPDPDDSYNYEGTSGKHEMPICKIFQEGTLDFAEKQSNEKVKILKEGLYIFELRIFISGSGKLDIEARINDVSQRYNAWQIVAQSTEETKIIAYILYLKGDDVVSFYGTPGLQASVRAPVSDVNCYVLDWIGKAQISDCSKEISDIRVGADGNTYPTAGEAIREQIGNLTEDLSNKITKFYASNQGETHITDSDNGKIQDMMLYGKSEQFTTIGKNLLKIKDGTQTLRGVTVTAKDGVVTLKGTATESGWAVLTVDSFVLNGTYILSSNISSNIRVLVANKSFKTVLEQGKSATLENVEASRVCFTITEGETYDISNILIQIEKGSVATSYEPYTGGQPSPSPDYPQEIKSVVNPTIKICGKNLFDSKKFPIILNRAINSRTGNVYVSSSGNYCAIEKYIPFPYIGKKVSFNASMTLCAYDKDYKFISTVNKNNGQVPTGTMYVRFDIRTEDKDKAQIELSENTTTYEPYKEQTIQLPITLNAIQVSSGGNVTINGQQYIADYVDVERGKVVRMCERKTFNTKNGKINEEYRLALDTGVLAKDDGSKECIFSAFKYVELETCAVGTMIYIKNIKKPNNELYTAQELKELSLDFDVVYQLLEQQETDLTTEQTQALKELVTYYPVTNISVNSEQLDGYTVFNYPISMANGWNYVKQQLNDNRDYIYDMDTQSAEAYVNSEYAVALTELEV